MLALMVCAGVFMVVSPQHQLLMQAPAIGRLDTILRATLQLPGRVLLNRKDGRHACV